MIFDVIPFTTPKIASRHPEIPSEAEKEETPVIAEEERRPEEEDGTAKVRLAQWTVLSVASKKPQQL